MRCNYHTHTTRCKHAVGEDREYVECAVRRGLKVLGFSDHTPYPFPDGYVSSCRMALDEMEGYVRSVLTLKEEYASQIEIHLGLETEYYPACWEALLRFLEDYPVEYMILGQHAVDNEMGAAYSGHPTDDPVILDKYVNQVIAGMQTGRFMYVAHPDVINFTGDEALYEQQMRRLCREAIRLDIPMEINFLGIWDGRDYPSERFWKLAGEEGVRAVYGVDAHIPDRLLDLEQERIAESIRTRYGLDLIEDPFAYRNHR